MKNGWKISIKIQDNLPTNYQQQLKNIYRKRKKIGKKNLSKKKETKNNK